MSGWSSTGGGRRRSLDGGGNEFGFDRPMISTRNMDFATGNSTKGADLVPGMSGVGVYVPREGPSLLSPTAGASIGERGTADLGGNNQQRKKERLKNYLLSSGYTPNPRADGEGAQDDRVMNLLGSVNIYGSNDSGAAKSAAYNERLRAGTSGVALGTRGAKPTENPSQGGLLASPSNHQNNSRGHIRPPPRRSMLDEGGPDVASTIDEICVAQGDVAYGNQGGLFTPAPSHRGDVRTPMDATVLVTPTPQRKTTLFAHEGDGEGCWITVFGFGSAMQSVVLREFRAHGEIVRHIPGKGNWIHILYRTPFQAQLAVNRGVRVVGGNTMVGVIPNADSEAVDGVAREAAGVITSATRGRDLATTSVGGLTPQSSPPIFAGSPGPLTPLGAGNPLTPMQGRTPNPAALGNPATNASLTNTPRPNRGLSTRLSEFVFGW